MDNIIFYSEMCRRGMISSEDADREINMSVKKEVIEKLNKVGQNNPTVSYLASNKVYRLRIFKSAQEVYGLKSVYFGNDENVVWRKIYDDLKGNALKDITLGDIMTGWAKERADDPDVAASTINSDNQNLEFWKNTVLWDKKIATISAKDIYDVCKSLTQGRQMKKKRFTNKKSALNLAFDYAVNNGYIADNVARHIRPGSFKYIPEDSRKKVLSLDEYHALIDYLKESNNIYDLCVALGLCLGTRIGETRAIHWDDFDFDNNTVYIHREIIVTGRSQNIQIEVDRTKSGMTEGNRTVPLSNNALIILDKLKNFSFKEGRLFEGKTGGYLLTQEANDHLKAACRVLGFEELSSHKGRATVVTECLRNGMDEVTAMQTFGWSERDTIQSYTRPIKTLLNQQKALVNL